MATNIGRTIQRRIDRDNRADLDEREEQILRCGGTGPDAAQYCRQAAPRGVNRRGRISDIAATRAAKTPAMVPAGWVNRPPSPPREQGVQITQLLADDGFGSQETPFRTSVSTRRASRASGRRAVCAFGSSMSVPVGGTQGLTGDQRPVLASSAVAASEKLYKTSLENLIGLSPLLGNARRLSRQQRVHRPNALHEKRDNGFACC